MNPWGLRDLDPLGNHKHLCALRAGVYIGFQGHLNPVDPLVSSYNLYLSSESNAYQNNLSLSLISLFRVLLDFSDTFLISSEVIHFSICIPFNLAYNRLTESRFVNGHDPR